jgi:purine-cytosine permease-like protein
MNSNAPALRIFKSSVKGTFFSATFLIALGALLATVFYLDDNYSNSFTLLNKYYLSSTGLTLGVLIPIYVGAMTAALVFISKRFSNRVNAINSLRYIGLALLVLAYILTTFLGTLVVLYLGS